MRLSMESAANEPLSEPVSVVSTGRDDVASSFVAPWPVLKSVPATTSDQEYTQYRPPNELRLLLDPAQTPPEIRNLIFKSLDRPVHILSPPSINIPESSPQDVDDISPPQSRRSSQSTPYGTFLDQDQSPTVSATSLALSVTRESTRSDSRSSSSSSTENGARKAPKKPGLSSILSSTNSLLGSVKQAIRDTSSSPSLDRSVSPAGPEKAKSLPDLECASCLEDLPAKKMFILGCTHSYCPNCFTTLIITAMQTESMFPPKCCLSPIPLKEVLSVLDKSQKELFKSKAAEYSLKPESRWYCPNTECGKWIPPSKLHRLRITGSKCPSCDTKICGYCRGKAHNSGVECPEDFGLEATLEEAERQGWRRCYKCRALVELTVGCRHITCKCKAQFCYTCGAKWRTCNCSEMDQARRQEEIIERRQARDATSREEEEEIARAVAAIEAMERREAEERVREAAERERKEKLQRAIDEHERRRREHLERLEAEKRKKEEAEAARKRDEVIRASVKDRICHLRTTLLEIQQFQQSSLVSRHNRETTVTTAGRQDEQAADEARLEDLRSKLRDNSDGRRTFLQAAHAAEEAKMTSSQEAEEDDTFLSMQKHLRDKPNKDARIRTAMDRLAKRHKEEIDAMKSSQNGKMKKLCSQIAGEMSALEAGFGLRIKDMATEISEATGALWKRIGAERKWFEVTAERRRIALQELIHQLWIETGIEPSPLVKSLMSASSSSSSVNTTSATVSTNTTTTSVPPVTSISVTKLEAPGTSTPTQPPRKASPHPNPLSSHPVFPGPQSSGLLPSPTFLSSPKPTSPIQSHQPAPPSSYKDLQHQKQPLSLHQILNNYTHSRQSSQASSPYTSQFHSRTPSASQSRTHQHQPTQSHTTSRSSSISVSTTSTFPHSFTSLSQATPIPIPAMTKLQIPSPSHPQSHPQPQPQPQPQIQPVISSSETREKARLLKEKLGKQRAAAGSMAALDAGNIFVTTTATATAAESRGGTTTRESSRTASPTSPNSHSTTVSSPGARIKGKLRTRRAPPSSSGGGGGGGVYSPTGSTGGVNSPTSTSTTQGSQVSLEVEKTTELEQTVTRVEEPVPQRRKMATAYSRQGMVGA